LSNLEADDRIWPSGRVRTRFVELTTEADADSAIRVVAMSRAAYGRASRRALARMAASRARSSSSRSIFQASAGRLLHRMAAPASRRWSAFRSSPSGGVENENDREGALCLLRSSFDGHLDFSSTYPWRLVQHRTTLRPHDSVFGYLRFAVEKKLTAELGRMSYGHERPVAGMAEIRAMLGPLDRNWRSTW
jgi:hypothetical protein